MRRIIGTSARIERYSIAVFCNLVFPLGHARTVVRLRARVCLGSARLDRRRGDHFVQPGQQALPGRVRGAQGGELRRRARRDAVPHRPLRGRKDDAAQADRRDRARQRRHGAGQRPERLGVARIGDPLFEAPPGPGLSGPEIAARQERVRQCHAAARRHRAAVPRSGAARARRARQGRAARARKGQSRHFVGRRAAASVRRARGGQPARDPARRRAHREPGCRVRGRNHGDVQRFQSGRGHRARRDARSAADRQVAQARPDALPREAPVRAWIQHHVLSFAQTLARLARSPFATALNVVAIAVALALGAYCVLGNLESVSHKISVEPQVSVFLAGDAAKADIVAVEARLKAAGGVRAVRFVSRETALVELSRTAGMQEVIASLRRNPLPDAFVVTLAASDPALADQLELQFKSLSKVAHVQADSAWVRRLDALLRLGRTAVVLLSALLGLALVAVTFNTIRLQILTQRDEIELCRLIGATHAYIRRPFFYLGSLLGLVAALAIVLAALAVLNRDLEQVAPLYGSDLRLRFPNLEEMLAALAASVALGWLGAYLSVSRHLLGVDPIR